ncbi:hypothetical protein GCM10027347_44780 [Larkinella harenae]
MLTGIQSNLLETLRREVERLQQLRQSTQSSLVQSAQLGADLVRERIQTTGRTASGTTMTTRARQRIGRYSRAHGRRRRRAQRQVEHVDFTLTGELMSAWGIVGSDAQGVSVGFKNDGASEIAQHLEDYFGPAFDMTPDERERASRPVYESVNNLYD